jgi:hypothetical protein
MPVANDKNHQWYMNVSVLGMSLIFVVGGLIILVGMTVDIFCDYL